MLPRQWSWSHKDAANWCFCENWGQLLPVKYTMVRLSSVVMLWHFAYDCESKLNAQDRHWSLSYWHRYCHWRQSNLQVRLHHISETFCPNHDCVVVKDFVIFIRFIWLKRRSGQMYSMPHKYYFPSNWRNNFSLHHMNLCKIEWFRLLLPVSVSMINRFRFHTRIHLWKD